MAPGDPDNPPSGRPAEPRGTTDGDVAPGSRDGSPAAPPGERGAGPASPDAETDPLPGLGACLAEELRAGDDVVLWRDAARRLAAECEALDTRPEAPPRHVVLVIAKTRKHRAGVHPDASAIFTHAWERDRGGPWTDAGARARVRSRRGHFSATLCLPQGTAQLAWIDAVVLWRPGLPWAPPGDTETGRLVLSWRRDATGAWVRGGTR